MTLALLIVSAPRAQAKQPTPPQPSSYLQPLQQELQQRWPKNRTLRIACHGHSVPAGYFRTPKVDTFRAYPHLLHRALKQRYPNAVLNVIVTAIGGENSASGSKRFERDVLALRPDLITIDYALNDRRLGRVAARAAMVSMLKAAKKQGVPVLLLTPTPDQRADPSDPKDALTIQAALVRQLAAEFAVGLVDSQAAFAAEVKAGTPLKDLMSQSNHPNHRGHQLVLTELMKWFPTEQRGR